ncbi:MAG: carbon monoxide dehydrogenase subunit G [Candidatus Pacebacteria bacterium]|nr:carbon monoxide dehydrogenase subunit G [Candidatus Paceibacterota bacterium]
MELTNSTLIAAPRDRVWAGLNNPGILQHCLSGCESLELTEANQFTARLMIKIGPVKARFSGIITLSDLNPPHSYCISGEGQGGVAGYAKGQARVELAAVNDNQTNLSYWVTAEIGGKLAQLGDRLIQGTATKLSVDFFAQFTNLMNSPIDLTQRYDKA